VRRGIRFRLGILLAAFGVLATGLTGLYSYTESRALLVRAAERELMSAAVVFGGKLAEAVVDVEHDARLLAALHATHELLGAGGADGIGAAEPRASLEDAIGALLRANPEFLHATLLGPGPRPVPLLHVDSGREAKPREPGGDPPTLSVTMPVNAGGASGAGAIVITIDLHRAFLILRSDLPVHLKLLLADERGHLLAASGFDRQLRRLQDTFADVRPLFDGKPGPLLARATLEGRPAGRVLGAFVTQPLVPGSDRRVVVLGVAEPLSQILSSTRQLGRTALQIVLAVSAIAIGLAWAAARRVTRPLQQMTGAVRRFSSEQSMGELPVRRDDEIGDLARGIDEMRERIGSMLAELDASRNRLAHMARHDPLTGLPNRTVFIDRLEHAIVSARRSGKALAVLFIDVDRFKHVNDTHGHGIGDQVLVQSATFLRSSVREADTVSRWGGDEFVILLEGMDEEHEARRVAQTLLDRFSRPMRVGELALELGVSIGISMYPRDAFEADELIQRADEAMYLSKHRAGNRYSVFGNQIDGESVK